jgi:hypothetical protein
MVAALVGVVWAIKTLNSGAMNQAFDALGLQAGGAGSPGLQAAGRPLQPGEERFNLCPTRIVGFVWNGSSPEGRKAIEEKKDGIKMHWMAQSSVGGDREIAYLEIEKWLTSHCQIVVRLKPNQPADQAAGEPVDKSVAGAEKARENLEIAYVDSSRKSIETLGPQTFRLDGKIYESPDFADALKELRDAAQL